MTQREPQRAANGTRTRAGRTRRPGRPSLPSLTSLSLLWLVACGADTTAVVSSEPAPSAPAGTAEGAGAVYVVATAVSTTDDGSTTYVALLDNLESQELDLSRAREFAGFSDLAVIDGRVFVSSGETPEVYRFTVGDDGQLAEDGVISFASYVSDAGFYSQEVVSPTKAYLAGENELVIWNPATLEITGTLAYPELPTRDGIEPFVALDRGAVVRDGRLYVAVAWSDTENLNMLPGSRILVIDVERDAVEAVLETPCVDLAVADRDEQGNLYFSNWVYSPGATLLYGDDSACAVRIPAGETALDDWRLTYAEVNGREGAVLGYVGEGKWFYSSFLGDPGQYDPKTDDWFDWLFGDTWQIEVLDPVARTSQAVAGLPRNGGGYYSSRFDGVTHVLVPGDGYETTSIHALAADGSIRHELDALGWSTRLFRVR